MIMDLFSNLTAFPRAFLTAIWYKIQEQEKKNPSLPVKLVTTERTHSEFSHIHFML